MSFDFNIDAEDFNDAEPICSFPKLKEQLTAIGVNIGTAGTWRSVGTVAVLLEDIGERILFEDDGIFYIDDDGVKHRGFMYKTAFYFEWEGRKSIPKFHICKCTAIESFGSGQYRFANAEPIKVFSRNEKKEVMVEGMELCSYCRQMLVGKNSARVVNSTDFVEILKEAGDVKESTGLEVDFYGYVRDWKEISQAYLTKMKFTCERCGTHVDEDFDQAYMRVHHKNGNKTDNYESNLECLCIRCYADIDDIHRHNIFLGANRVLVEEYMRKYHGYNPQNKFTDIRNQLQSNPQASDFDDDIPF